MCIFSHYPVCFFLCLLSHSDLLLPRFFFSSSFKSCTLHRINWDDHGSYVIVYTPKLCTHRKGDSFAQLTDWLPSMRLQPARWASKRLASVRVRAMQCCSSPFGFDRERGGGRHADPRRRGGRAWPGRAGGVRAAAHAGGNLLQCDAVRHEGRHLWMRVSGESGNANRSEGEGTGERKGGAEGEG